MLNLLRANFYKLWKMKSFYICTAAAAAFSILGIVSIQVSLNMEKQAAASNPVLTANYKLMHETVNAGGIGYLCTCIDGLIIPVVIAIVVSLFVCADFSTGAIKNMHGFHRNEIYFSTLIVTCALSVIMTLVYMLASFAAASIAWGVGTVNNDVILNVLKVVGVQSLLVLGCAAIFVMVATLIRNSGGTIAVNLGSLIVLSILLGLISKMIGNDVNLQKYAINNCMTNMAVMNPVNDVIIRCLIVAGCYIVVPTLIGLFAFQKRDIK